MYNMVYKSEPRLRRASVQGRRKRPSAGQRVSPPNGCRRPNNGILYIILLYVLYDINFIYVYYIGTYK